MPTDGNLPFLPAVPVPPAAARMSAAAQCQRQRHAYRASADNDEVVIVMMRQLIPCFMTLISGMTHAPAFYCRDGGSCFHCHSCSYLRVQLCCGFVTCSCASFLDNFGIFDDHGILASRRLCMDLRNLRRSHHNRNPRPAAATANNARNAVKKKMPRTAMMINTRNQEQVSEPAAGRAPRRKTCTVSSSGRAGFLVPAICAL